tara:strand:+ start:29727 stop:31976 length:2250 start_codon:yes stop_codon:yes gene_type:complete
MNRNFFGASALAIALCHPAAALAQSEGEASQAGESASSAGLDAIVVTAQRREENLQDAALAVSVVGGDALTNAGVTQPQDLASVVPALKLNAAGGAGTQVTIRGVGSFAGNAYAESGVAINLDGVYLARAASPNGVFYDLSRVEVLKGPQGTLYGRNATAGAINIITNRPVHDLEFSGNLEIGNYDRYRGELAVNLPVSDMAALRVSGMISRRDGYYSDGYADDRTDAVRAQLLLDSGGPFSVLLAADYASIGGQGSTGVFSTGENTYLSPDPRLGPSRDGSNQLLQNVSNLITMGGNPNLLPPLLDDGFVDLENWGVSATISAELGAVDLTVIPAYRRSSFDYLHYNAGFPVASEELSRTTSLEVRLASSDSGARLQWIVGGFYFNEDLDFSLRPDQGVAFGDTNPALTTRSLAAFGELTFSLTDKLRLTGGIRYTNENKQQGGRLGARVPPADPTAPLIYFPLTGDNTFENVTFKAGVEYDAGPESLIYADVRTGFKAGGYFASAFDNVYEPERLTAFTLGSKNRFVGNSLQVNLEAFYWIYRDKQISHIGPVNPAGFNLITENADRAEIYGLEAEVLFQPTDADRLSANFQYLHTNYNRFTYTQTTLTGPPQTACATSPIDATSVLVDCSGRELPRSPELTIGASYEHTFFLGDGSELAAKLQTRIETSSVLGEEYLAGQYQGSYMLSGASLTWRDADDRFFVTAFVDNIEDEVVKVASFIQPVVGLPLVTLASPRTYGVRVGFDF